MSLQDSYRAPAASSTVVLYRGCLQLSDIRHVSIAVFPLKYVSGGRIASIVWKPTVPVCSFKEMRVHSPRTLSQSCLKPLCPQLKDKDSTHKRRRLQHERDFDTSSLKGKHISTARGKKGKWKSSVLFLFPFLLLTWS